MENSIIIKTELDTKSFEKQIKDVEYELKQLDFELSHKKELKLDTRTINEYTKRAEILNNKLIDLKKRQADIGKLDFSSVKKSLQEVGNSVQKVIGKVIRWGLAIFSIRSAYLFVRQAMSTLTQYDDQMASNVEYLRYSIASLLKPVIEGIINLVHKLLVYTAYIIKAWTGVNIFANLSANSFKKAKDNLGGASKNAKELQKTLAGFDEMNVLQENGNTASGGGGGGVALPTIDLANWEDVEMPDWVKWIADNKDMVLGFFDNLLEALLAFKVAQWTISLLELLGILEGMSGLAIFGMLAGIAVTLYGIFETVQNVIEFIKDPSWENFNNIISSLGIVLAGVGVAMVAFNATNPVGWILLAVGAITSFVGGIQGLATAITVASVAMIAFNATNPAGWIGLAIGATVGIIGAFGNWATESENTTFKLKDTEQATEELRIAQNKLNEDTTTYTSAVKNQEEAYNKLIDAEKRNKISGEQLFQSVQIGTLKYKDMNEKQREVFDAYVANKEAEERLDKATQQFTQSQKEANIASSELSGAVLEETGQLDSYFQELIQGYRDGKVETEDFYKNLNFALYNMSEDTRKTFMNGLPNDIKDGLSNAGDELSNFPMLMASQLLIVQDETKEAFANDIPNAIDSELNSTKYDGIFSTFRNSWNNMINNLNKNVEVKANIKTSVSSSGVRSAKGALLYPSRLPKLAVGGIVNMPGAGVPYSGATIGERGAEAVVPLTDSQQMALLGEAIGKYITVNANIVNTMNGRIISRELQKVQNDSDFAYNR